jgi:hypothetical protein
MAFALIREADQIELRVNGIQLRVSIPIEMQSFIENEASYKIVLLTLKRAALESRVADRD